MTVVCAIVPLRDILFLSQFFNLPVVVVVVVVVFVVGIKDEKRGTTTEKKRKKERKGERITTRTRKATA